MNFNAKFSQIFILIKKQILACHMFVVWISIILLHSPMLISILHVEAANPSHHHNAGIQLVTLLLNCFAVINHCHLTGLA